MTISRRLQYCSLAEHPMARRDTDNFTMLSMVAETIQGTRLNLQYFGKMLIPCSGLEDEPDRGGGRADYGGVLPIDSSILVSRD